MLQNKEMEIIIEFIKGYFQKIYGSQLIGKVHLSQKAIALALIKFERRGILTSQSSGNRKYYCLNFDNPLIEDYLAVFENLNKIDFLERNKTLIDFANEVKSKAIIISIFGSYAKDKNTKDSDLDLLVIGKAENKEIKKIAEKYGIDIQIFNFSISSFRKGYDNLILKECLKNHVLLKGYDLFVQEVVKWKK